ncbi:IS66 family insertion sequence element accessory protein TnpB [Pseudomonas syringae pv. tagetis]|uniref:IS66 family insertion sequence element accessory protein TnpB n=2 Tax=Pseudomonas TaxID=286 RepID=A0A0Q0CPB5_9PSED|nr:IS66 family insertion sequence element accessory protein TnpB [Pseudomonas syringae group genomosp. 7]KPY89795.1 Transposase [Pseudomonas syringae pv. tagetis]RMW14393.1 Transposase [Pseudomonas syringae pv. tagetis]UNB68612.1 IS66 family insertion sequence element accessory protein TnpB [Pseudomonas syringae pv. tagetis]
MRHRQSELANRKRRSLCHLSAKSAAMIRIDTIWFATEPMDMRAGTDTAMARVISVFGAAQPHCAYLFANRRATRMKVLVHDGLGKRRTEALAIFEILVGELSITVK